MATGIRDRNIRLQIVPASNRPQEGNDAVMTSEKVYDVGVLEMAQTIVKRESVSELPEDKGAITRLYAEFMSEVMTAFSLTLPPVVREIVGSDTWTPADRRFVEESHETLNAELSLYFQNTVAEILAREIAAHFTDNMERADARVSEEMKHVKAAVGRVYQSYFAHMAGVFARLAGLRSMMDERLAGFFTHMDAHVIDRPLTKRVARQDTSDDSIGSDAFMKHLRLGKLSMTDTLAAIEKQYDVVSKRPDLSPTMVNFLIELYSDITNKITSYSRVFDTLADTYVKYVRAMLAKDTAGRNVTQVALTKGSDGGHYTFLNTDNPTLMDALETASLTWSMYISMYRTLSAMDSDNFPLTTIALPLLELMENMKDFAGAALLFEKLFKRIVTKKAEEQQFTEFWKNEVKDTGPAPMDLGYGNWSALRMIKYMYTIGVHKMATEFNKHIGLTEGVYTQAVSTRQEIDVLLKDRYNNAVENKPNDINYSIDNTDLANLATASKRLDALLDAFASQKRLASTWKNSTEALKVIYQLDIPNDEKLDAMDVEEVSGQATTINAYISRLKETMARVVESTTELSNPEMVFQLNAISSAAMGNDRHAWVPAKVDYNKVVEFAKDPSVQTAQSTYSNEQWLNLAHLVNVFTAGAYKSALKIQDRQKALKQRFLAVSAHSLLHQFMYLYDRLQYHADLYQRDMTASIAAWNPIRGWVVNAQTLYTKAKDAEEAIATKIIDADKTARYLRKDLSPDNGPFNKIKNQTALLKTLAEYATMLAAALETVSNFTGKQISVLLLNANIIPTLAPLYAQEEEFTREGYQQRWKEICVNTQSASTTTGTETVLDRFMKLDGVTKLLEDMGLTGGFNPGASSKEDAITRELAKLGNLPNFSVVIMRARERQILLETKVEAAFDAAKAAAKQLANKVDSVTKEKWEQVKAFETQVTAEDAAFQKLSAEFEALKKSSQTPIPVNMIYVREMPKLYVFRLRELHRKLVENFTANATNAALEVKDTFHEAEDAYITALSGSKKVLDKWEAVREFVSSTAGMGTVSALIGALESMALTLRSGVDNAIESVKKLDPGEKEDLNNPTKTTTVFMKAIVETHIPNDAASFASTQTKNLEALKIRVAEWNKELNANPFSPDAAPTGWAELRQLHDEATQAIGSVADMKKTVLYGGPEAVEKEILSALSEYTTKDAKDVEGKVGEWLDRIKSIDEEVARARALLNEQQTVVDKGAHNTRLNTLSVDTLGALKRDISKAKLDHIALVETARMKYANNVAVRVKTFRDSIVNMDKAVTDLNTEMSTHGFSSTVSAVRAIASMTEETARFDSVSFANLERLDAAAKTESEEAKSIADNLAKILEEKSKSYDAWQQKVDTEKDTTASVRSQAESERKVYLERIATVADQLKSVRSKLVEVWTPKVSELQKAVLEYYPKDYGTLAQERFTNARRKHEHLGNQYWKSLTEKLDRLKKVSEANPSGSAAKAKSAFVDCMKYATNVAGMMLDIHALSDKLAGKHGALLRSIATKEAAARVKTLADADNGRYNSLKSEIESGIVAYDSKKVAEDILKLVNALFSAPLAFEKSLENYVERVETATDLAARASSPLPVDKKELSTKRNELSTALLDLEKLSDPAFDKALSDTMINIRRELDSATNHAQKMLEDSIASLDAKRSKIAAAIADLKADTTRWFAEAQKQYDVSLVSPDTGPYDTLTAQLGTLEDTLKTNFQTARTALFDAVLGAMNTTAQQALKAEQRFVVFKERIAKARESIATLTKAIARIDALSKLGALVTAGTNAVAALRDTSIPKHVGKYSNTLNPQSKELDTLKQKINTVIPKGDKAPGSSTRKTLDEHLTKLRTASKKVDNYDAKTDPELTAENVTAHLHVEWSDIQNLAQELTELADAKHAHTFSDGLLAIHKEVQAVTRTLKLQLDGEMDSLEKDRARREVAITTLQKDVDAWVPDLQREYKLVFADTDLAGFKLVVSGIANLHNALSNAYFESREAIENVSNAALTSLVQNEDDIRAKIAELHRESSEAQAKLAELRARLSELEDVARVEAALHTGTSLALAAEADAYDLDTRFAHTSGKKNEIDGMTHEMISTISALYADVVVKRRSQVKPIIDEDVKKTALQYTPRAISEMFSMYRADLVTLITEDVPGVRMAASMINHKYTEMSAEGKSVVDAAEAVHAECARRVAAHESALRAYETSVTGAKAALQPRLNRLQSKLRSSKLVGLYAQHAVKELGSAQEDANAKVRALRGKCSVGKNEVAKLRNELSGILSNAKRELVRLEEGVHALESLAEKALSVVERQINAERYAFTTPSAKADESAWESGSGGGGGGGDAGGGGSLRGGRGGEKKQSRSDSFRPIFTPDMNTVFAHYTSIAEMNDNRNMDRYRSRLRERMGGRTGIFCGNFFLSLDTLVNAVYRLAESKTVETDTHQTRLAMGFLYHFMLQGPVRMAELMYASSVDVQGLHSFQALYDSTVSGGGGTGRILNTLEHMLKAKNDLLVSIKAPEKKPDPVVTDPNSLASKYEAVFRVLGLLLSTTPSKAEGESTITVQAAQWAVPDLFHYYTPVWCLVNGKRVSGQDAPSQQLPDQPRMDLVRKSVRLVHKRVESNSLFHDTFELVTTANLGKWTILGEYVGRLLDSYTDQGKQAIANVKQVQQSGGYTMDNLLVSSETPGKPDRVAISSLHFGNEFRYLKAVDNDDEVNCIISFPLRKLETTSDVEPVSKESLALVMTSKPVNANTVLTVKRKKDDAP